MAAEMDDIRFMAQQRRLQVASPDRQLLDEYYLIALRAPVNLLLYLAKFLFEEKVLTKQVDVSGLVEGEVLAEVLAAHKK